MSDAPAIPTAHLRKVRSFVRRPGRVTAAQRRALEQLLPRYGVPSDTMHCTEASTPVGKVVG